MEKCIGCGAPLQCEDESKAGFINPKLIGKENVYCLRCFRLRNYNEKNEVLKEDYLKIISSIKDENALIVHIVDLFDFSSTFISSIKRQTGQNDCIIVGNKFDVFPKSVKQDKVVKWVRHMANLEGFNALDVILTSAKTLDNIELLMESIIKYSNNRPVYFVGCSNVGKSSLINAILKRYTEETRDVITTSNIPGTTLDFIEIHLDQFVLVDSPGIFNEHQIIHNLTEASNNIITPKKEIRPITYQLNEAQSVFMGGLARFDFIKGDKTSFTFYFSNNLLIHRTKLEKASDLFSRQVGELLTPPTKEEFEMLEYYSTDYTFDGTKKMDLVISGLGFIVINSRCKIRITTVKGVNTYVREAII